MRIRCHALGCCEAYAAPVCERCGYHIYDRKFVEWHRGWLTPVVRLWFRVRSTVWPRCGHCRRRLWLRRWDQDFCSKECFDKWIPF
jgi:hypothetical protein